MEISELGIGDKKLIHQGEPSFKLCTNKSQRPKFQYLSVVKGEVVKWLESVEVKSLGGDFEPSFMEFPLEIIESFLSQILENNVPLKYFLSNKACEGILRRAKARGKDLPEVLRLALEEQASADIYKKLRVEIDTTKEINTNVVDDFLYVRPCSSYGLDLMQKAEGIGLKKEVAACLAPGTHGGHGMNVVTMSETAGTLDASYYKGTGMRCGIEREFVAQRIDDNQNAEFKLGNMVIDPANNKSLLHHGKVPTLCSRMGTGGNQVPCVMFPCGAAYTVTSKWAKGVGGPSNGNECQNMVVLSEPIPIHDKATRYKGGGCTRNGDGAGNGFGVGKPGDPCPTLLQGDRHAIGMECGIVLGFKGNASIADNAPILEDKTPCMQTKSQMAACDAFKQGNSATARGIGYAEELCPTLTSGENGTNLVPVVLCFEPGGSNEAHALRAEPSKTDKPSSTTYVCCGFLESNDKLVLFEPRSQDGVPRIHGDVSPTLNTAQGGQRQPCIAYAVQGSMIGRTEKNGPQGDGVNQDVCFTLNTIDRHGVCCPEQFISQENNDPSRGFTATSFAGYAEAIGTLKASGGDLGGDSETLVVYPLRMRKKLKIKMKYRVRRLTPLECERLQGLPDGWTKVLVKKVSKVAADKIIAKGEDVELINGEWWAYGSDTARYKALGNGMAQVCVDYVIGNIARFVRKYKRVA